MARIDYLQSDFSLGELSPLMAGRRDLDDYRRGLDSCLNAIVGQRGEWVRRPGTHHFRDTIDNQPVRLVDMITAEQRPILLEFGDGAVRISAFDGLSYDTWVVTTPYDSDDIWSLDWAQSGNSLFLVHANHPPQVLSPDSGGGWQMTAVRLVDGPYLPQNTDQAQRLSVDANGIWAPPLFTPFTPQDVGRAVRIRASDGIWHWGRLDTYTNSRRMRVGWSKVETGLEIALGKFPLTIEWQLGAFWDQNYPTAICFHQDRLVLATTASNPQTFWASQSADYVNYGPTDPNGDVLASSAILAALSDRQINRIQWLVSAQESLVAGTASGLWLINGEGGSGAIAPATVQAQRLSGANSADVRPTSVGRSTLFVERSTRRLLALSRDSVELVYLTPDISVRSEHILTSEISAMAYQAVPWSCNWCLMQDGTLAGLTMLTGFEREQVLGWHRHEIAGQNAKVISIASIPGLRRDNQRKQDQLFMVVERTLAAGKHISVEVLGDAFDHDTDLDHAVFVDGAVTSQSSLPFTYNAGFGHLEGQELRGLSDGRQVTPITVSNGAARLEVGDAGRVVSLGLAYTSRAQMMDVNPGGLADGMARHGYEVILRLWRSVAIEASADGAWFHYQGDDLDRRLHTQSGQGSNGRDEPYSGALRLKRDVAGWSRALDVGWRTSSPLPLCVLSAMVRCQDSTG